MKKIIENFSIAKRNRSVLQLFLRETLLFLQCLKQINNAASIIQKKLEQSSKNKQIPKLSSISEWFSYPPVAFLMASKVISAICFSSAFAMLSGGISTMTSPRGRIIRPFFCASLITRMPTFSSTG